MFKKLISLMLCIAVIAGCVPAMAASKDEAKTEPTVEEQMVSELLAAQVKKQKDVWVLAILQAGAQDIAVKDGKLCFSLCSFQPELQDLGAYSKASDKVKWRKAALKTVADYDLKFEMELTKAGQVGDKARNDFINTVKKAANNAKKALASKDIASAIEDMLFCEPVSANKVTADTLKKVTKDFKAFIKANKKVLTGDAVDWAPLFYAQRKLNYSIVHYESPDHRGIDCALLYRRSSLKLLKSSPKHLNDSSGALMRTRDILLAEFDSLAILVNHHPSKVGSDSDGRRNIAMRRMTAVMDSLAATGTCRILSVGDFNDDVWGVRGAQGTIKYNGAWEKIDGYFAAGPMEIQETVFAAPCLTEPDRSFGGTKPRRAFSGPRWLGGISDHYPVVLRVIY